MQVYLPVPLCVQTQRQNNPRQLAREYSDLAAIRNACTLPDVKLQTCETSCNSQGSTSSAARPCLFVDALKSNMCIFGHVELGIHNAVASGYFVNPGGPVADPLPRHKNRQFM